MGLTYKEYGFHCRDAAYFSFCSFVSVHLLKAISERGSASMRVSDSENQKNFCEILSLQPLPWEKIIIVQHNNFPQGVVDLCSKKNEPYDLVVLDGWNDLDLSLSITQKAQHISVLALGSAAREFNREEKDKKLSAPYSFKQRVQELNVPISIFWAI